MGSLAPSLPLLPLTLAASAWNASPPTPISIAAALVPPRQISVANVLAPAAVEVASTHTGLPSLKVLHNNAKRWGDQLDGVVAQCC